MGKIIYIVGKSATGKDTIYNELKSILYNKAKPIIATTTRPIRPGEVNGETYNFIDDQTMMNLELGNKIIEQRKYETVEGLWTYATINDNIDITKNNYIGIGTLVSLKEMKKNFGNDIIPIYIEVDNDIRMKRSISREALGNHNYNEMCRRWLADEDDFSQQNIDAANVITVYNNENVDVAILQILKIIISKL